MVIQKKIESSPGPTVEFVGLVVFATGVFMEVVLAEGDGAVVVVLSAADAAPAPASCPVPQGILAPSGWL